MSELIQEVHNKADCNAAFSESAVKHGTLQQEIVQRPVSCSQVQYTGASTTQCLKKCNTTMIGTAQPSTAQHSIKIFYSRAGDATAMKAVHNA